MHCHFVCITFHYRCIVTLCVLPLTTDAHAALLTRTDLKVQILWQTEMISTKLMETFAVDIAVFPACSMLM